MQLQPPSDPNILLRKIHMALMDTAHGSITPPADTQLSLEDEAFLGDLLANLRHGAASVIIVQVGDKTKFMFAGASRAEALGMMGKVIETTSRKL